MARFKILHITDFHLDDITSPKENLRKAYYKQFLGTLYEKISQTIGADINILFATGDFINKGKVGNFPHAILLLNHLVSQYKLTNEDVGVCIGNHDLNVSLDKLGKLDEARKEYNSLRDLFHFPDLIVDADFYRIYFSAKLDCYLLVFDSTMGAQGNNKPSVLNDLQIDNIRTAIDEKIPLDKPLFVLSHYPMILFNRSRVVAEVDNWVDDHLWKSGNTIVEGCYYSRKNSPTFWFFGDGHIPDFWSYNNHQHFLMTGMIGGNYTDQTFKDSKSGQIKAYNKTNEVKVIEYDTETNQVIINTYSYRSKAYEFTAHSGVWEHSQSEIRMVDNPFEKQDEPSALHELSNPKLRLSDSITQTISTSVQDEILEQIKNRRLYSFNRFATSPSEISLGWVAITRLFQSKELLSRCIEKSVEWLFNLKTVNLLEANSIFIGIDFWGAIFASQATILKSVENYCIGTKSRSEHNILLEKPEFLCQKINSKIDAIENVVLFTDVISTGNTIITIKEKIQQCLGKDKKINWIAVSIISDIKQTKKQEINNFTAIGSLCTDLRIPILKNEELPDIDILPIKYDIR